MINRFSVYTLFSSFSFWFNFLITLRTFIFLAVSQICSWQRCPDRLKKHCHEISWFQGCIPHSICSKLKWLTSYLFCSVSAQHNYNIRPTQGIKAIYNFIAYLCRDNLTENCLYILELIKSIMHKMGLSKQLALAFLPTCVQVLPYQEITWVWRVLILQWFRYQ